MGYSLPLRASDPLSYPCPTCPVGKNWENYHFFVKNCKNNIKKRSQIQKNLLSPQVRPNLGYEKILHVAMHESDR